MSESADWIGRPVPDIPDGPARHPMKRYIGTEVNVLQHMGRNLDGATKSEWRRGRLEHIDAQQIVIVGREGVRWFPMSSIMQITATELQ